MCREKGSGQWAIGPLDTKIATLTAALEKAGEALRSIEWAAHGEFGDACLVCGEDEDDGHIKHCVLRAALAEIAKAKEGSR